MDKKALGSVVSVGLLLVVSVLSVVSFQSWFSNYSSDVFIDVEDETNGEILRVESVIDDELYLYSNVNSVINFFQISDNNGAEMCNFGTGKNTNFMGDTKLLMTFDDNARNLTHTFDFSGYNYDGELKNGVNCFDDICEFDGNNWIDIVGLEDVYFSEDYVYVVWFKGDMDEQNFSNPSGDSVSLLWKQDDAPGLKITDAKKTRILVKNFTHGIAVSSSNLVINNDWNFVLSNYDFDKHLSQIYLNRGGVSSKNHSGGNVGARINGQFKVGRDDAGRYFKGYIDEIGVYSKALKDDEISILRSFKKALMYEQILSKGVKKINVSSCNLIKGNVYNFMIYTDFGRIQVKKIVK